MKKSLIVLFCIIGFCCKSGKKESTNTTVINDSIAPMPPPDPPPGVEIMSAGTDMESFGDIKLGQHYKKVLAVLGEPDSKSEAQEWAADGLMHENWTWKSKGLVLNMSSDDRNRDSSLSVFMITATAPCSFKTKAGMGIGSTYEEVYKAYEKNIDPEATGNTHITVGSVYGGIIFNFKNNKAERVFLGAEAE